MSVLIGTDTTSGSRAELSSSLLSDTIFTDHKGRYKKSIEKRQSKLLDKLPPLKGFLDDGERVAFVTTGCSPTSIFEQLLTGWMFVYLKRCVLVFTDRRIIHVPSKTDYSYKNSLAEIRFQDCRQVKLRGSTLRVRYKSKRREAFLFIARRERRKIKMLLESVEFSEAASEDARRASLCPRCATRLPVEVSRCESCRLPFKSRAEARKLGLLLPGGGYFYTRHPFLGIADAFVELVLILAVVSGVSMVMQGEEGGMEALVTFSVVLFIEKFVSVYHSNHFTKEYITEEKNPVYYSATAVG